MTEKRNVKPSAAATAPAPSRRTILLIEDEDIVRVLARKLLEANGFAVLDAESVGAARKIWKKSGGEIDLLFADVQLPDGSTKQLARDFQRENPKLRVIFMSGYTEDVVLDAIDGANDATFVQKPFQPRELVQIIEAVLKKTK